MPPFFRGAGFRPPPVRQFLAFAHPKLSSASHAGSVVPGFRPPPRALLGRQCFDALAHYPGQASVLSDLQQSPPRAPFCLLSAQRWRDGLLQLQRQGHPLAASIAPQVSGDFSKLRRFVGSSWFKENPVGSHHPGCDASSVSSLTHFFSYWQHPHSPLAHASFSEARAGVSANIHLLTPTVSALEKVYQKVVYLRVFFRKHLTYQSYPHLVGPQFKSLFWLSRVHDFDHKIISAHSRIPNL